MTNRRFYRDLINEIERDYSVTEWIHNGYHIWPVLRVRLFLKLVAKYEKARSGSNNKSKRNRDYLSQLNGIYTSWRMYNSFSKSKIDTIYCGTPSHRIDYKGRLYNRYFDFLMDEKNGQEEDLLVEYKSKSKKVYYKPDRVFLFDNLISLFKIYDKKYRIGSTNDNVFIKELDLILKERGCEIDDLVTGLSSTIHHIDRSSLVFAKVLERIEPKEVYQLCYYSPFMFGLNIAADRMDIPTIDMQHGPQGEFHLAYGSWESVPETGYEALPNRFYAWDTFSADDINSWATSTTKHKAICTGNPWVKGWKQGKFTSSDYTWPSNLILYTLQPTGNPLNDYILQTIEHTKSQWNWWLRVHPRQLNEIPDIKEKLKDLDLLDYVNMDDATSLPLPEILLNTKVHVTKFSGCAVEAFNFDTPTILLDSRGAETFSNYMYNSYLMSVNTSHSSKNLFKEINQKLHEQYQ